MKRFLLSGAMLLAATFVAAQQATPPSNPPPVVTPDQQMPEQKGTKQMPPDVVPQQGSATPMATTDVQKELQTKLDADPALQSAHVSAVVDDNNVTLAGTVPTEEQHQEALRIAHTYAGERKLVDNIKVQGTT